jgi:hypothetical protein
MKLAEWMDWKKLRLDNVLFVSVGTDGLSESSSVMSVSVLDMVGSVDKTWYIDGAKPELVTKYTGVSKSYYDARKKLKSEVSKELLPIVSDKMLVSYSVEGFTRKFLVKMFPEIFSKKIVIDVIELLKLHEVTPESIDGETCTSLKELEDTLAIQAGSPNYEEGYKLVDCFFRVGICPMPNRNDLELKTRITRQIFFQTYLK